MMRYTFIFFVLVSSYSSLKAQVGIGTANNTEKATLEVSSQINGAGDFKGFMTARVATEVDRDAIPTVASDIGLQVFVTGTGCLDVFNGTNWEHIKCNSSTPSPTPPPRRNVKIDSIPNNSKL